MQWPWRYYLFVPASLRAQGDGAAVQLTGNPADVYTFSVALSGDGADPATFYGCSLAATDTLRARMEGALPSLPGLLFYRCDAHTGTLDGTNSVTAPAPGSPFSWAAALADNGLKVVSSAIGP